MKNNLKDEIKAVLSSISASSPVLQRRTRVDKLYEIYVSTRVLSALQRINASQIQVHDRQDNITSVLNYRLAPGVIYGNAPSSHISFMLRGKAYEMQNGVRVLGKSSVLHELDICIVDRTHAIKCRRTNFHPKGNKLSLAIECKYYGKRLPLRLGREYLGLVKEFPNCTIKTLVTNVPNSGINDVRKLISGNGGMTNHQMIPQRQEQFISYLTEVLDSMLP